MSTTRIWFEATRPKTLLAALCPVLVGTALAARDGSFDLLPAAICLFFAILVQVGTNFANDYLDGIKGTDTDARLGPRRSVASGLIAPSRMRLAAVAVLVVAFLLGLSLIPFGGWWLLMVGVSSVLCAWLYTGGPYPLAYNGLGDVFVVIFFGLIAVNCTYYVQVRGFSQESLLLGLSCGLVINNLLVVNNYRDVEEDRQAGKRTLVVLLGRPFAQGQFLVSLALGAAVLLGIAIESGGWWVLLGALALIPGFSTGLVLHRMKTASEFALALKKSAMVVALYGALVSIGLIL
jgi:1,4-dihydroxy-2-naphthoate octaprenyltransferase